MFISYLVVLIFLVLLGWYGILLAPFLMGILRQHIHRCPKCLNAIKEKSIFSSLEDNVRVALYLIVIRYCHCKLESLGFLLRDAHLPRGLPL